jgi:hypothetical protein
MFDTLPVVSDKVIGHWPAVCDRAMFADMNDPSPGGSFQRLLSADEKPDKLQSIL